MYTAHAQGGPGCFANLGGVSRWKLTIDIASYFPRDFCISPKLLSRLSVNRTKAISELRTNRRNKAFRCAYYSVSTRGGKRVPLLCSVLVPSTAQAYSSAAQIERGVEWSLIRGRRPEIERVAGTSTLETVKHLAIDIRRKTTRGTERNAMQRTRPAPLLPALRTRRATEQRQHIGNLQRESGPRGRTQSPSC